MSSILVVGSINTDLVIRTSRIPKPGETILGGEFSMQFGGKGANQAVAAKRLGGDVQFICKTGNDIFGQNMRSMLQIEQLDTSTALTSATTSSGTAIIVVDEMAENSIVVAQGANADLSAADLELLEAKFKAASYILLQMEISDEAIFYCIEKAASLNKPLVLNPAPARTIPVKYLQHLYCITPNETETALLTGIQIEDEASMLKAAEVLLGYGIKWVIITLGKRGAFVAGESLREFIDAPEVKAIDTTAAGDVFNGALVVSLSKGQSISDAVAFAVKAASVSVTKAGALDSAPFLADL